MPVGAKTICPVRSRSRRHATSPGTQAGRIFARGDELYVQSGRSANLRPPGIYFRKMGMKHSRAWRHAGWEKGNGERRLAEPEKLLCRCGRHDSLERRYRASAVG